MTNDDSDEQMVAKLWYSTLKKPEVTQNIAYSCKNESKTVKADVT